jgi:hypothetical protein
MRTSKRWARYLPLLVLGGAIAALGPVPSQAHTTVIRAIPQHNQVVRAVDPNQAKLDAALAPSCATNAGAQAWGSATANIDNPCDVRVIFNQPVTRSMFGQLPSMKVTKLGFGGGQVYGEVFTADTVASGVSTSSSAPSAVTLNSLPGDETVIFRRLPPGGFPGVNGPWIALDAGDYQVVVTSVGIDGHLPNCDPPPPPPCDPDTNPGCDDPTPPTNCYKFNFTIAPTPETPVITDPLAAGTVNHRNYLVHGTAEPGSAIEIFLGDPTDLVADTLIGTGGADIEGNFEALSGLSAGANQIYAAATSAFNTTTERKVCTDADDPVTPCVTPKATSAAVSFTATVDPIPDITAPETAVDDYGAGELFGTNFIQITNADGDPQAVIMKGHSSDNDQVAALEVTVTDGMGAPVAAGADTYEVSNNGLGQALVTWEVHFHGTGIYNIVVVAKDAATPANESDPDVATATYVVTYGDELSE